MTPKSPVIKDKQNIPEIIVAKHQEEYNNLPVIKLDDFHGTTVARWELDDQELKEIVETKSVYVSMWTFGRGFNPMSLQSTQPDLQGNEFPVIQRNTQIIAEIKNLRDLQKESISSNQDGVTKAYMTGLYNGLELALAKLENRDPVYLGFEEEEKADERS